MQKTLFNTQERKVFTDELQWLPQSLPQLCVSPFAEVTAPAAERAGKEDVSVPRPAQRRRPGLHGQAGGMAATTLDFACSSRSVDTRSLLPALLWGRGLQQGEN